MKKKWLLVVLAVAAVPAGAARGQPVVLGDQGSMVMMLAFSADGRTLASGGMNGSLKLWEMLSGKERASLRGHPRGLIAGAFSGDGRWLAWGGHGPEVWLREGSSTPRILRVPSESTYALAFAPNGRLLVVGGGTTGKNGRGDLWLWDVRAARSLFPLVGHSGLVAALAFSPDGRVLATGDAGGNLRLWEVASGRVRSSLPGHKGTVWAVAFAPDGQLLASGGMGTVLHLWDVRTGKERAALKGHTGHVYGVAFARGGKLLVSASLDKTVRLWDVDSGKLLATAVEPAPVYSLAVSPDGKTVVAGAGRRIKLWDVDTLKRKGK
jgi:WD40 repeat protein